MENSISVHNKQALIYDEEAKKIHWHGSDILFAMCFEYLKPDTNLLDIGIGTGLSSILFAKAGLEIFGLDGSSAMLDLCRKKNISQNLKLFELKKDGKMPYESFYFDYIISSGFFQFFGNLKEIFKEVKRMLKKGGFFAFIINDNQENKDFSYKVIEQVKIYMHSEEYIKKILEELNLEILKKIKFIMTMEEKFICNTYLVTNKE